LSRNSIQTDKVIESLKQNRMIISEKCSKQLEGEEGVHVCSQVDGEFCNVYAYPDVAWRRDDCPMADEKLKENYVEPTKQKIRVGQQKQKKRK
jgi:hypothetical protein